jgi:hypothetical protein
VELNKECPGECLPSMCKAQVLSLALKKEKKRKEKEPHGMLP